MAAQVELTSLQATLTSIIQVQLTRLVGTVAGTVGVEFTQLIATRAGTTGVRFTALSGQVAGLAGAPVLSPPGGSDVRAGTTIRWSVSATFTPPAVADHYTWRIVSRDAGAPLPTFSDPTIVNPTMHVPLAVAEYNFTVGVTVTDSLGHTSTEVTIPVKARKPDILQGKGGQWQQGMVINYGGGGLWGG